MTARTDVDPSLLAAAALDGAVAERIKPRQLESWVRDGIDHATLLQKEGREASAANCTVFWIRLNGIFSDIEPWARETLEEIGPPESPEDYDPRRNPISDVLLHIAQLRGVFTDDELIWIHYERQHQAHATPDKFFHAVNGKGNVSAAYEPPTLGKPVTRVDASAAQDREYERCGRNEKWSAVCYAAKALLPMANVCFALQAWRAANS